LPGYLLMLLLGLAFAGMGRWSASIGPGPEGLVLETLFGSAAFLMLALAPLAAAQYAMRRLTLRMFKKRSRHERALAISPEGVAMREIHCECFDRWNEYSSVEDDDRFLVFYQQDKAHIAYLVPKAAFATAVEADRFSASAKSHFQRHHPLSEPELAPIIETGNPYQAPTAH
jgi:hypothetical protein